jgi:hypothetical protein
MSMKYRFGFASMLALTLAACGSNELTDDAGTIYVPQNQDAAAQVPGSDAATTADTTPVVADPYVIVVIQDTEQKACTTNGPGSDIDAVAKLDSNGIAIGWGMKGTAKYTANPAGNACENTDCSGSNCKYAAISKTFDVTDLVARTEGPADGVVNDTTSDTGYFSLNAGTLQIKMGDVTGAGPSQPINSGDWIAIYEVDKSYIDSGAAGATCVCAPEHYTVTLQSLGGKLLPLAPALYNDSNTACTLTAASTDGCGSTTFAVP